MVSKWKRAIRKGHTSFLVFYFWYLKLVPIDSALNFASGKLTWISKKCTNGFKKDCQIWKSELIFSEMSFVIYSRKTGKYLNQIFFAGSWPGIVWIKQYLSRFDSTPLTSDPALFPGTNIPNIAKSNRIFPRKGRWDKEFILIYLDSSIDEVFPHYCLIFSIFSIFRRKRGVLVGPKVLTLGPSPFHK